MAAPVRTDADMVEGTIVFTDLVGFTEFTATRGDAEALQLLATQDRLVRSVLPDRARIVKELGDGLFLWFPEPDSALRCALELHRILDEEAATTGLRCGSGSGCTTATPSSAAPISSATTSMLRRGSWMSPRPVRCSSPTPYVPEFLLDC